MAADNADNIDILYKNYDILNDAGDKITEVSVSIHLKSNFFRRNIHQ